MKAFYSHLVIIEDVLTELDNWDIPVEEKAELVTLIEQTLHHHTLNIILSHLPEELHDEILTKMEDSPGDSKLMELIKKEIKVDIEEAIKNQAARIKKEILQEIRHSRKR